MMSKMIEQANGPALTLIYRGAMFLSVAVFIWFATQFLDHKDDHSQSDKDLAVALTELTVAVDNLNEQTSDLYTASEAHKDIDRINGRITALAASLNERLTDMKDRVRELEKAR